MLDKEARIHVLCRGVLIRTYNYIFYVRRFIPNKLETQKCLKFKVPKMH